MGSSSAFQPVSPRASQQDANAPLENNMLEYQLKRLRSFETDGCVLKQETVLWMQRTIRNAMNAGQGHARLQTLTVGSLALYISASKQVAVVVHPLYNTYTLQLFGGTRVQTTLHVKRLTDWLYEQGLHFIFTSERTSENLLFGEPVLSKFVHVVAVFVPHDADPRETPGHAIVAWNTLYMQKCLDSSMVPTWNKRLFMAIQLGASHFFVSTLYYRADYYEKEEGKEDAPLGFHVKAPRHHLTMMPITPAPRWMLNHRKFADMVAWITSLGYGWTLCTTDDGEPVCTWAYFTALLNPIATFI